MIRQRFGIAAPRVEIQTQIPWYWRWAGIAILLGVAGAAAHWIYDAGRRFAGFDRSEVVEELPGRGELECRARGARRGCARSRMPPTAGSSIERTAQQKLAQQIRTLEQENARVREELATFEKHAVLGGARRAGLSIYRFKVEPDVLPGEYRYRLLLLTPSTGANAISRGASSWWSICRKGGSSAMMSFPEPADAGAAAFRLDSSTSGGSKGLSG